MSSHKPALPGRDTSTLGTVTELARPDAGLGSSAPRGDRDDTESAEQRLEALSARVKKLERKNRLSKLLLLLAVVGAGFATLSSSIGDGLVVERTLMESKELKLLDNDGNARLFLRMYSRVPVMQLMDSSGRPRISLGLRFDDSPFLVLSDRKGNKRFSLEMDSGGDAALRLLGEDGELKFSLQ